MPVARRSRASWAQLVAEAERSGSLVRTAERHGVSPKRLAWWRWSLQRSPAPTSAKLLPVVVGSVRPAPSSLVTWLEIASGDVTVRVPAGTDVAYVAALIAALRSTC